MSHPHSADNWDKVANLEAASYWEETVIFSCARSMDEFLQWNKSCPHEKCRCCAAGFTGLLSRGRLKLTPEMLAKCPTDDWKQIMAKAVVLAMLDRT